MTPYPNPEYLIYSESLHLTILGVSGGQLMSPYDFGVEPKMDGGIRQFRGYIGFHKIVDKKLYVDRFVVASGHRYEKDDIKTSFKAINGIYPTQRMETNYYYGYDKKIRDVIRWSDGEWLSDLTYFDLNIEERFTGGLLVGLADLSLTRVSHAFFGIGTHDFFRIGEVLFEEGNVINFIDHSEVAKRARNEGYTKARELMNEAYTQTYQDFYRHGWSRPKEE